MTDTKMVRQWRREIERAPICTPVDGEYVGDCHVLAKVIAAARRHGVLGGAK